MAAKIDALLKLSVIASLLLASSGVGYYYAVYLPRRDAELDHQRMLDKAHAEEDTQVAQQQSLAARKESEQRHAADRADAEARYQTCLNGASVTHDASWAAECKRLAEKALQDHASCLSKSRLSQEYCDTAYRTRDSSPNCTLPVKVATDLDGGLNRARNRCLQERKAALQ